MPLKGIPAVLSPDILHTLATMGHGDEIVLADAHFPSSSICRHGPKEIRADGVTIPVLLDAIMQLFKLDQYYDKPVMLMERVPQDAGKEIPIWAQYQDTVNKHEGKAVEIERLERFAFYDRAKQAFAVIHSGETAQYANIILKKGVVTA